MEIIYALVLGGLGLIGLPTILTLTGAIGGFAIAETAQRAVHGITNSDVAAMTRAWARSLALGGALAGVFFAYALAVTITWRYLETGLFMTVGFAIAGLFAGLFGARTMFRHVGLAAQHGVEPTRLS